MINNIYFAIGCLAIIYVIYWAIKNDRAERIEDQVGLLRMPPPTGERHEALPEKWRPGPQRPRPGTARWQRPVKPEAAAAGETGATEDQPPRPGNTHQA
jgi:hypothetical protein